MRRVFRAPHAAALVIAGFLASADTAMAIGDAGCQRATISVSVSPDGVWVALMQEDLCSDGYFVTTLTSTVQLVRRDAIGAISLAEHPDIPNHENDVFGMDADRRPERRPIIRWLSSTKVQITVPNKSLIGLKKARYSDVEVVIRFEPDDPDGRRQWLRSLGLPED